MTRAGELRRVRAALAGAMALVDRMLGHEGQALDVAVLGLLDEGVPLSTDAVARLTRRRRADVRAMLRGLEAQGRVAREGSRWILGPPQPQNENSGAGPRP
jgi:hypothetical protein